MTGIPRQAANWLADHPSVPTPARAVFGYYGDVGVFDYESLKLKRRVDDETEEMIDEAFEEVESEIETRTEFSNVSFSYDTKLILPAQLTLGYLYRNDHDSDHIRELTRLVVEALIEGDMRDAINDSEFEDFVLDNETLSTGQRKQIAEIAQSVLYTRVEDRFDDFEPVVRHAYEWAVDVSESHQNRDPYFRDQMQRARKGELEALDRITTEYKFDPVPDYNPPGQLTATSFDGIADMPYFKTQYCRVGVLYDGMIEMYRAAGVDIPEAFKRSVVLAIIGAQIWLDDIDDFEADRAEGQLTPVTAEYLICDTDREAARTTRDISNSYFDEAKAHAEEADSHLTGLAVEYIYRRGDPSVLPGIEDGDD